jgi:redox-sensitive bicupin YhaK (pirin superfamily)
VTTGDADAVAAGGVGGEPTAAVELAGAREAAIGALPIRRALPQRARRTIGAWCFLDHMGPTDVSALGDGLAPHPHIGLQTVTWLLSGQQLHRDSLGSEQPIRPGQLNLMTAGRGVAHSEERIEGTRGELHGVQLWVAQPAATRDTEAAFEHHPTLPQVEIGDGTATALVGTIGAMTSPARRDTDHVGAELLVRGDVLVPLDARHEHGLVVLDGLVDLEGQTLAPGTLAYLGVGRDELALVSRDGATAMLVGGVPFGESLVMWWNYVARSREEVVAAHDEWTARGERFGAVASPLPPIDVDPPPWSRP